jgi:hypothetical protein
LTIRHSQEAYEFVGLLMSLTPEQQIEFAAMSRRASAGPRLLKLADAVEAMARREIAKRVEVGHAA